MSDLGIGPLNWVDLIADWEAGNLSQREYVKKSNWLKTNLLITAIVCAKFKKTNHPRLLK